MKLKKYNYKNVLITGNKLIKISNLLNKLGKIFKIKKKPVYIYNPNRGHYDVTPYNYKPLKKNGARTLKQIYPIATPTVRNILGVLRTNAQTCAAFSPLPHRSLDAIPWSQTRSC